MIGCRSRATSIALLVQFSIGRAWEPAYVSKLIRTPRRPTSGGHIYLMKGIWVKILNGVICGTTFVKWGKKREISLNGIKAVKKTETWE